MIRHLVLLFLFSARVASADDTWSDFVHWTGKAIMAVVPTETREQIGLWPDAPTTTTTTPAPVTQSKGRWENLPLHAVIERLTTRAAAFSPTLPTRPLHDPITTTTTTAIPPTTATTAKPAKRKPSPLFHHHVECELKCAVECERLDDLEYLWDKPTYRCEKMEQELTLSERLAHWPWYYAGVALLFVVIFGCLIVAIVFTVKMIRGGRGGRRGRRADEDLEEAVEMGVIGRNDEIDEREEAEEGEEGEEGEFITPAASMGNLHSIDE